MNKFHVIIIGGGAAGFFCAVNLAERKPGYKITILEKSSKLLSKVRVSGGGRCNVTHSCFDNNLLAENYPRGSKELKGAFSRFSVKDILAWFEDHGVSLKTEDDGRMFPSTNNSETIINCFLGLAGKCGIEIRMNSEVIKISRNENGFSVELKTGMVMNADKVIVAMGGHPKEELYGWIKQLGHSINKPVPSLFTFNIPQSGLTQLMGVSVSNTLVKIVNTGLQVKGPLLITHWGVSGPVILRLSSIAARKLHELNYNFQVSIGWVTDYKEDELQNHLQELKLSEGNKNIYGKAYFNLSKRLWDHLLQAAGINENYKWADIPKKDLNRFAIKLINDVYNVSGKTTYKEEFVTCGGLNLKEIDFKTMESRLCKDLYFAGEVLDIDGITGGFNFQNAWTTAWLVSNSL